MHTLLPKLGCAKVAAAAATRVGGIRSRAGAYAVSTCNSSVWASKPHLVLASLATGSLRSVRSKAAASAHQQQQEDENGAKNAFYAEKAAGFEELGLTPALVQAMRAAGFSRPSRVQELVVPKILSGKNIVLAAETGSGKTLAYIAPLSSLLQHKAASGEQPPSPDMLREIKGSSSRQNGRPQPGWMCLVLCPNTALCHQVVRLVSALKDAQGQPLLRACHISSSSPPPFDPPDIVVTTPGALKTLFNDRGAMYGSQWTAEAVSTRAAFVVVDEADLLWQGGYVKDLTRLLDAFKSAERRIIEAQVLQELDLDRSALDKLPRNIKEACWKGGVPAMRKAGLSQARLQRLREEQPSRHADSLQGSSQLQQQQQRPIDAPGEAAEDDSREGGYAMSSSSTGTSSSSNSSAGSSDSQAEYRPYFKRQYLFIAATMPALTKGDVGIELQKRFPGALWVSGDMLHQVKPHVDHAWVRVGTGDSAVHNALLAAIESDPDYQAGKARVLVFTGNTGNADRVSAFLHDQGISNHLYHKNISNQDQAAALSAMAHPTPGDNLVMVSTDAAARGIDLPEVSHVIQADFVANAIEFLHRVGRTARAGRRGKVTSLYGASDVVLAEALRKYVEAGEPVEDCFSRNRSFSRKVKRYGTFVPRGQEGPQ